MAAPERRSRRRALLIATGTYEDTGLAQLRAPTGDVDSFARVLGNASIGEFDVREPLIDRSTEEIKKAVERFFGEEPRADLLLLYFSGHGVLSQSRRFFFATRNTELQSLRATAIEDSFVNDVMRESRARSIVLVLDCCHSGAFGKGLAPKGPETVDVEHRFEGVGRVTLSASTALEYAFEEADPATGMNELEPAAPGSLFTRCLVEGLESGDADTDNDGDISVDELYEYVRARVRERSPHQSPGKAGEVHGEIVIARSGRRPALDPELDQAVKSPFAGIREGAVSELAALLHTAPPAVAEVARQTLERLAGDDSAKVSRAARAALGRDGDGAAPRDEARPVAPPDETRPVAPPDETRPPPPPPWWRRRAGALAGGAAALIVAAVAAVLLIGGGDGPSPRAATGPYDFDGDGRQEVVLGAARASASDSDVLSGVVLIHSGAEGRLLRPEDAGVDAPAARGDRFGAAIASGDFDRNGKPDLAIGVPGRDRIALLYGRDGEVDRRQVIAGDQLEEPPATRGFGFALTAADFNGDRVADLAVGAPGSPAQREAYEIGAVHVFFGGRGGLAVTNELRVEPPAGKGSVSFGSRLAAGDVNRDGNVDLVEGALDEPDINVHGHIAYCPGTPDGPLNCEFMASTSGAGTSSLAIADVNGDDYPDIVQGDQGNREGSEEFQNEAGSISLWLGEEDGPSDEATWIGQDLGGIPGDEEAGDEFGHDVEAGDVDGDGFADIIVAARYDEGGDGTITVIRGAGGRPGFARRANYTLEREPAEYGSVGSLALLDVDGDGRRDLVVARENTPTLDDGVVVYRREANGFAAGAALPGLADLANAGDSPLRLGR